MHSRLQALINRGYSSSEVISLAMFTEDELNDAVSMAFDYITRNCFPSGEKKIIYVGGQPGSGKTVMSMKLKDKIKNIVEIGIDNYRMYHPRYLEIEKCIRKHWDGREENLNDTPGNDIADFTHVFAGAITDRLIDKCSDLGFDIIIEWGMREPDGPLKTMKDMKNKGYNNFVTFVCVDKETSFDACCLRADVMKDGLRIIRKVSNDFHSCCIDTLPYSVSKIYNVGYNEGFIDYMCLINRDGEILWDDKFGVDPSVIYDACLNSLDNKYKNDLLISYFNNKVELGNLLEDSNKEYIYSVVIPKVTSTSKER